MQRLRRNDARPNLSGKGVSSTGYQSKCRPNEQQSTQPKFNQKIIPANGRLKYDVQQDHDALFSKTGSTIVSAFGFALCSGKKDGEKSKEGSVASDRRSSFGQDEKLFKRSPGICSGFGSQVSYEPKKKLDLVSTASILSDGQIDRKLARALHKRDFSSYQGPSQFGNLRKRAPILYPSNVADAPKSRFAIGASVEVIEKKQDPDIVTEVQQSENCPFPKPPDLAEMMQTDLEQNNDPVVAVPVSSLQKTLVSHVVPPSAKPLLQDVAGNTNSVVVEELPVVTPIISADKTPVQEEALFFTHNSELLETDMTMKRDVSEKDLEAPLKPMDVKISEETWRDLSTVDFTLKDPLVTVPISSSEKVSYSASHQETVVIVAPMPKPELQDIAEHENFVEHVETVNNNVEQGKDLSVAAPVVSTTSSKEDAVITAPIQKQPPLLEIAEIEKSTVEQKKDPAAYAPVISNKPVSSSQKMIVVVAPLQNTQNISPRPDVAKSSFGERQPPIFPKNKFSPPFGKKRSASRHANKNVSGNENKKWEQRSPLSCVPEGKLIDFEVPQKEVEAPVIPVKISDETMNDLSVLDFGTGRDEEAMALSKRLLNDKRLLDVVKSKRPDIFEELKKLLPHNIEEI